MRKVALTIKEGRKASLFFHWLILGPLALFLLPYSCQWSECMWMHITEREALAKARGLCIAKQTFR